MRDGPQAYPPLEEREFELRFTRMALVELGCPRNTPPGDLDEVARAATFTNAVILFPRKRDRTPLGTETPIRNVGRPDIYSLHGTSGGRAITWHDEEVGVCWFLGWTSQHEYRHFEERAANRELLPDEHDYMVLLHERETMNFDQMFAPRVKRMFEDAVDQPGIPLANTVLGLLEIEITVHASMVDDLLIRDVYLSARIPPLSEARPPGWPGRELTSRLVCLALDCDEALLNLEFPSTVPSEGNSNRSVDWSRESAIRASNVAFSLERPLRVIHEI